MLTVENFNQFIHQEIPLTDAIGIELSHWNTNELELTAPLKGNTNDKQTAFAGSLATLATLSGWAMTQLVAQQSGKPVISVVASSELKFIKPGTGDLRAVCQRPSPEDEAAFLQRLKQKGKAVWPLSVTVYAGEQSVVTFAGKYVARVLDPA